MYQGITWTENVKAYYMDKPTFELLTCYKSFLLPRSVVFKLGIAIFYKKCNYDQEKKCLRVVKKVDHTCAVKTL